MTLGDRLAVISGGELQQVGTPQDVYEHPANVFVAHFIGSPPMNLLHANASGGRVRAGELEVELAHVPDGPCVLGIRPESLSLIAPDDPRPSLRFRHRGRRAAGRRAAGPRLRQRPRRRRRTQAKRRRCLPPTRESRAEVTVKLDGRLRLKAGERVRLTVHPGEVYAFDAASGDALTG